MKLTTNNFTQNIGSIFDTVDSGNGAAVDSVDMTSHCMLHGAGCSVVRLQISNLVAEESFDQL